jgi:hypothetical protein
MPLIMILSLTCYNHNKAPFLTYFTFYPALRSKIGMVDLTWMAEATKATRLPQGLHSWGCLGIGHYLMILLISKRLTMAPLEQRVKVSATMS